MISPSKVMSMLAVGFPLAFPALVVQAEVISLNGEVVQIGYPGKDAPSYGLVDQQGELIAWLQASSSTVPLAEGSARIVVEHASGTGAANLPVLLVAEQVSNSDGRETSDPFSLSGPAAFSGNVRDRSQVNWAGVGHRPQLPSASADMIFSSAARAVPAQLTGETAAAASFATTAASVSGSTEAALDGSAAVKLSGAVTNSAGVAPMLAAQLDGGTLRLTWVAPAGALCLILGSLDAAGPYEVISSQLATEDGPMSFAVPVTETSGFLRLQINSP